MQAVSSSFDDASKAPANNVSGALLVSWNKVYDDDVTFFTIGESQIGGNDIIRGAGDVVTFFDKYEYNVESPRLMQASVERKLSAYTWGVVQAQLDVRLDNTDKRYFPGFDEDIGDNIRPKRPIKCLIGYDSEQINLFVGFTDVPSNTYVQNTTTLHAFDAIDYLYNVDSEHDQFVDMRADEIIEELLFEAGFAANQFALDMSLQQPIGFVDVADKSIGEVIEKLCQAEQALFFADEDGIIRFWNRQHLIDPDEHVAEFDYSNISNFEVQDTEIINHVVVRAKPRAVEANQKIWELDAPQKVSGNSSETLFIEFSDDDGDLPVTNVDAPEYITEATTSRYSTNENEDGSGATRDGDIEITSTSHTGSRYIIEFANTSGSPVYITTLEVFGTPAKVQTNIEETFKDSDSIREYGRNPGNDGDPLIIENNLIQHRATAKSAAYIVVNDYKEPFAAYRLEVFPMPHLQIGDLIKLTIDETAEEKDVMVFGVELRLSDTGLVQALYVEERDLVSYFTIEESTIEGDDVIAP